MGGRPEPSTKVRERLRARGLRATAPRVRILVWLAEHPHSTASEVDAALRAAGTSLSTQGIYDVLGACTEAGLLRRIEPGDSPARFETRAGDNHHHLVCRSCGRTEDVDCTVGAAPCLTPEDDGGFVLDEAELVFWGLCPACTAAPDAGDGEPAHEPTHDAPFNPHQEARQ